MHRSSRGFWVLSRFEDVHRVSCDPARFSSAQGLTFTNETELLPLAPTIVMMDPPEHTRYRRLVNRGFSPPRVSELEPELRRYVRRLVEELVGSGGGDLASGIASEVPAWLVARYLGVPEEDRPRFRTWTGAIVQANAGAAEGSALEALGDLYRYFVNLVEYRRVHRGGDLVSSLLAADEGGEGIGLEGILGYAFVLIAGGNDTTAGLLTGSAELLSASPDQRRDLVADRSLLPGAVDELLRLTSPVQGLCRVTTTEVEVRGQVLGPGERVLLCYGAANRDPREFGPDAENLDVRRRARRHLAFSSGPHHCLGAAAARLIGRVVVDELLRRCPEFEVDAAAGTFAPGPMTRRYDHLPIAVGPLRAAVSSTGAPPALD